MEIHTKIEAILAPDAPHSSECERDHEVRVLSITSTTGGGGRCETEVNDCLLYEMEDAITSALIEAWEESDDDSMFWSADFVAAHDEAVRIAAKVDTLADGGLGGYLSRVGAVS